VGVPAAGQVGSEAPRAFEVVLLVEQMPDHGRDFPDLHVLQTQLPVEPCGRRFRFRRGELVAGRGSEDSLLFPGGVAANRIVEFADGVPGRGGVAGVSGAEESSEKVVQAPVLARKTVREGRRSLRHSRRFFHDPRSGENEQALTMFRRRIAPLFATLLLLAPGCREKADPVQATLDRMRKAAEARDVAGVVENLTPDFREAAGGGTSEVSEDLRRYFAAYEIINLMMRDVTIERAPEAVRARFRVEFSGQPRKIGGLDGLLPSASTYSFDVRLVPDGSRWKVAWAAWEPTGSR
jgi:hypothetical protein